MSNDVPEQTKSFIAEINQLEKAITSLLYQKLTSDDLDEISNNKLRQHIDRYFHLFYLTNRAMNYRIHALIRLLKLSLTFPVKYNINAVCMERIYRSYSLIDKLTFHIYQFTDELINSSIIDRFLNYVKGTASETLFTFFLFRVSPDYVRNNFRIDNIDELNPEELYYGISTGYFSFKQLREVALDRLYHLASDENKVISSKATEMLYRLKHDGYSIAV